MTNGSLARSYLRKACDRLDVLDLLERRGAFSDVVREAREVVELALKAMLRHVGVEPPKWHDVGTLLEEHTDKLPPEVRPDVPRLAAVSKWLRKERELGFYGDIDFIPTDQYSAEDAARARTDANVVVAAARRCIGDPQYETALTRSMPSAPATWDPRAAYPSRYRLQDGANRVHSRLRGT